MRADARRNRERVLEAAREAFKREGADASLDDIAKRAGVGSATLYRHYPTREALIEAVYHREVEALGALGSELMSSDSPVEALRVWMLTFVDHVIDKQVIASALNETAYAHARVTIHGAVGRLTRRAIESGDVRDDTVAVDLLGALIGALQMGRGAEAHASARRLVDLLLRGATATQA